jgi:hypothetical protein
MPYFTNVDWLPVSEFPETTETIFLLIDHPFFQRPLGDTTTRYIAVQCEPEAIIHSRQAFIDNHKTFDTILSYDEEILKVCPNARPYVWGTSWISSPTYNAINVSRKKQQASCLTGMKELTPAHTYRKLLYNSQLSLNVSMPITWFRSSKGAVLPNFGNNPLIGDSKDPLFLDYQFSVVIENCRLNNYFTEKLVDCLITKTIPIYYGCPNISKWFDTRGWIILETTSIQEFRRKCTSLPSYSSLVNVINENFERAKQYSSISANIQRAMNFGVATRDCGD